MPRIKSSPAFTASAMKVDISNASAVKKHRQEWQSQAWGYWDSVGEVKYAIGSYIGGALQKIRIFPATRTGKDGEQIPEDSDPMPSDNVAAIELMDRLRGDSGGHGDLLKTIGINLTIAGECYLIGLAEEGALDAWEVRSIDEVKIDSASKVSLTNETETGGRVLTDDDFMLRIWTKHPRRRSWADSPLHGVLNVCESLLTYDLELKALSRSRAAGAGILWIPSQMSFNDTDGVKSETAFAEQLTENMMMPLEQPGSASSVVPFVAVADADLIDKVVHMQLERPFDEKLDERIEAALRRLAQGLTTPPEIVLGIADVNHWNALYISEDAFKTGVEGLLLEILWAITSGYLKPMLAEMGVTEDIGLWYDASAVTRRPNTAENATTAHEAFLISDESARRDLGFTEDDAPTPEEIAARVEILSKIRGRPQDGIPPANVASIRAAASPLGVQLSSIDQRLRERLWVASDMALRRMIEKMGSKVISKVRSRKDKALSETIKDVDVMAVPATLGPATIKSLGVNIDELLVDAFEEVERKWNQWTREAAAQALDLVPKLIDRKTPEVQLDNYRAEGWAVLEAGLKDIARIKLFDPTPDKPPRGEMSVGNLVSFALIRRAVAAAGGGKQEVRRAAVFTTGVGDAWVSLGMATGSFFRDLFSDNGVKTSGYIWEYGLFSRTRPFEPHEDLDGQFFENFDDEVLRNSEDWPPVDYFSPGDHDGCACDFIPAMNESDS